MQPGGRAASLLKQCRDCVNSSTFPFPCDLRQETEDRRQWKCAPKGSRTTDARRGVLIGWAYKGGSQLTRMEMASGPDASVLIILSAFS